MGYLLFVILLTMHILLVVRL